MIEGRFHARTPHSELAAAEERQFASVGHGTDFRYRSPHPSQPISASQLSAFQHVSLAGSALVHANELIHAAFFRLEETEQPSAWPLTAPATGIIMNKRTCIEWAPTRK